jgi:prepilin-type N-terminal cleavage/methylation domain-containing protein
MVVVVIIGILAAVATPYMAKDRKALLGKEYASDVARELQRSHTQALAERLPVRAFIYQNRVELRSWVPGTRPGDPARAATTSDPLLRTLTAPNRVDIYDVLTNTSPAPTAQVLNTTTPVQIDFTGQGQMQFIGQAVMSRAFIFIRNSNVHTSHRDAYERIDIGSPHRPHRSSPGMELMKRRCRAQAGFTLLEVMIALLVAMVGLIGTVAVQMAAMNANKNTNDAQIAMRLASKTIEEFNTRRTQANPFIDMLGPMASGNWSTPVYLDAQGRSSTGRVPPATAGACARA